MIIVPSWDLVWTVGDLFVNLFLTFFFFDGVFEKKQQKTRINFAVFIFDA